MIRSRVKKHSIRFLSYLLAFIFLKAAWWIGAKFGSPTLEQIVFHFQNGTDGLADADPTIFRSFIVHVIALPFLFALIVYAVQQLINSAAATRFINHYESSNISVSPTHRRLAKTGRFLQRVFSWYLPFGILLFGAFIIANKVALWSFMKNQEVSTFIEDNYRPPSEQNIIPPKRKPNLVLIYVESLEKGYSNERLMGSNLLEPLDNATKPAHHFDRLVQTTGTGWTIAGIVSSQCGVPLKSLSLFNIDNQKAKIKSFLPGIDCLGDVLERYGYKNIFMGGASLYFADKGKFFSEHGYSELYGKEEWSRSGVKSFSDWGLYDDDLLGRAKARLDALEKSKQPFNLTMLTVDTHIPKGYVNKTCAQQGVTDYKGIVSCTAGLVADFVTYMKQKGYLNNTVVVIVGDHLSMAAPLESELHQLGANRTIYNAILAPDSLHKNTETIYHFDLFPSILYAMGFRFDQNRLGLGSSGFGVLDPGGVIPKLDIDTFNELLAKTSRRYLEFWKARQRHEDLEQKNNKHQKHSPASHILDTFNRWIVVKGDQVTQPL